MIHDASFLNLPASEKLLHTTNFGHVTKSYAKPHHSLTSTGRDQACTKTTTSKANFLPENCEQEYHFICKSACSEASCPGIFSDLQDNYATDTKTNSNAEVLQVGKDRNRSLKIKLIDDEADPHGVLDLGTVSCDKTILHDIQKEFSTTRRWMKINCPNHCKNFENPDSVDVFSHSTPVCRVAENNGINLLRWSYPASAPRVFNPSADGNRGKLINSKNIASYKFHNMMEESSDSQANNWVDIVLINYSGAHPVVETNNGKCSHVRHVSQAGTGYFKCPGGFTNFVQVKVYDGKCTIYEVEAYESEQQNLINAMNDRR